jgi:hypothetical protein
MLYMKTTLFLFCWIIACPVKEFTRHKLPSVRADEAIDWVTTKDWKLYNIQAKRAFDWSFDTLRHFKCVTLNEDTMREFLNTVSPLPPERSPVWMGYYVASCRLSNGDYLKLEVSQYGGFFFEQRENRYYELSLPKRKDWLNFFAEKMNTFGE